MRTYILDPSNLGICGGARKIHVAGLRDFSVARTYTSRVRYVFSE